MENLVHHKTLLMGTEKPHDLNTRNRKVECNKIKGVSFDLIDCRRSHLLVYLRRENLSTVTVQLGNEGFDNAAC